MITSGSGFRFPCKKTEYCYEVGELGETYYRNVFRDLGFNVDEKDVNSNGVDLVVSYSDSCGTSRLLLVAEILNWWLPSYLTMKRARSIVSNLSKYRGIPKVLFLPFMLMSKKVENYLISHHINIVLIGFQILPKSFHDFYRKRNEIYARKRDSNCALSFLKNKILRAIRRIKEIKLIVFNTQSRGKKAAISSNMSVEALGKTSKTSLIHPTKHIKQRDKKRKKLLLFDKFLDFLVDLLSVKSASLTKTGGMIMKKKKNKYEIAEDFYKALSEVLSQINDDIYIRNRAGIPIIVLKGNGRKRWEYKTWNPYALADDCRDCYEFEKCWEIKGFKAQQKMINTRLKSICSKKYQPRQLTLEDRTIDDALWKEIYFYAEEMGLTLDGILKCLRKRNHLQRLFDQGKLEQDYSYFSTIPTD